MLFELNLDLDYKEVKRHPDIIVIGTIVTKNHQTVMLIESVNALVPAIDTYKVITAEIKDNQTFRNAVQVLAEQMYVEYTESSLVNDGHFED